MVVGEGSARTRASLKLRASSSTSHRLSPSNNNNGSNNLTSRRSSTTHPGEERKGYLLPPLYPLIPALAATVYAHSKCPPVQALPATRAGARCTKGVS